MDDQEAIAKELSGLRGQVRDLEKRLQEVKRVNARLEDAGLTTARSLQELSRQWDAVHEAMRREKADVEEELVKARLLRRFRGGPKPQADPLAP